jgi:small subunit ribosomal protein S19e
VGVERLRTKYGGRKNRGSRPQKSVEASGKILRTALQKLEKAGFIEQKKGQGRVMSSVGRAFVDKIATGLKVGLEKINPALQKY